MPIPFGVLFFEPARAVDCSLRGCGDFSCTDINVALGGIPFVHPSCPGSPTQRPKFWTTYARQRPQLDGVVVTTIHSSDADFYEPTF